MASIAGKYFGQDSHGLVHHNPANTNVEVGEPRSMGRCRKNDCIREKARPSLFANDRPIQSLHDHASYLVVYRSGRPSR
jgi:hypothetical protein